MVQPWHEALPLPDQAPLDGSDFMLASGEWPPPSPATKRGRFVAGLLNDMQRDNFLVAVRVRTKEVRALLPLVPQMAHEDLEVGNKTLPKSTLPSET